MCQSVGLPLWKSAETCHLWQFMRYRSDVVKVARCKTPHLNRDAAYWDAKLRGLDFGHSTPIWFLHPWHAVPMCFLNPRIQFPCVVCNKEIQFLCVLNPESTWWFVMIGDKRHISQAWWKQHTMASTCVCVHYPVDHQWTLRCLFFLDSISGPPYAILGWPTMDISSCFVCNLVCILFTILFC